MHNERWLIAATAGTWQIAGIKAAQQMGFKVIAIDGQKDCPGFTIADKSINLNISDTSLILKTLDDLKLNYVGAISYCSEAGMMLAAQIREHFSLPGPNIPLTSALINKGIQRNIWAKSNVPIPKFSIFKSKDDALNFCSNANVQLIVKPTDSAGSRGVALLGTDSQENSTLISSALNFSRTKEIIIEEYMKGTEYTVEVFCTPERTDLLTITKKKKLPHTNGTVAFELFTPELSDQEVCNISTPVFDAFKALGYTFGIGHAEVILKEDGTVGIIEVAGRGGGFLLFEKFIPLVTSRNVTNELINILTGQANNKVQQRHSFGVLRFTPSKKGRIKKLEGYDKVNGFNNTYGQAFAVVGQDFPEAACDGDRIGCIITWASSLDEALKKADLAEKQIIYEVE
ncbi:ATP-grasp domain-containing protein [Bacteriovorax sp. Seq25_V]|uniref:ATP-grasp domain-containing protein n=1 Tax=Bacteriovorax sp. Seq25_V TaxID=1201288 RepID=UPI00038A4E17|nr:ATP-grasp domain-containing protein [Bacteriovorax sp. Seq25_V]EQC43213.1 phosphoribosylamine--glycine ligase [Bacteriovorax sp. Seq25_V]